MSLERWLTVDVLSPESSIEVWTCPIEVRRVFPPILNERSVNGTRGDVRINLECEGCPVRVVEEVLVALWPLRSCDWRRRVSIDVEDCPIPIAVESFVDLCRASVDERWRVVRCWSSILDEDH